MEKITLDEKNKKRIQKYLTKYKDLYDYEEDISLLKEKGQLTEDLARKIFTKVMVNADIIRTTGLSETKDGEFKDLIDTTLKKYDSIPKPEQYVQYGINEWSYEHMGFKDIYKNMQTAFEIQKVENLYYGCKNLRDIASTAMNSIDGVEKYNIELPNETKEKLNNIQGDLKQLLENKTTDIKAIQEKVDSYNKCATDIWNDYLTKADNTKSDDFRLVVHNLTKGDLEGDFKDKYMSTSLITNNEMGLYGGSQYGLVNKTKPYCKCKL